MMVLFIEVRSIEGGEESGNGEFRVRHVEAEMRVGRPRACLGNCPVLRRKVSRKDPSDVISPSQA